MSSRIFIRGQRLEPSLFTMKCLKNKKVGHNRTDRDNPNFDVFAIIQSQNDYITTQLTMMGYKGEMLWAHVRYIVLRHLR